MMSEFLHVSLRSRGRDRTSEWYCRNLGFQEAGRGGTAIGTQTARLVTPTTNTYIEVSDRVRLGHDFTIPEELILLQFTVRDPHAAYERFRQNGVKITEGGPDDDYFFIEDADGYEIEITRGEQDYAWTSFGIRVSDLERSVAFYRDNLGFREQRRWTTPRGTEIAILELPGNATTLALRQMPFLTTPVQVPEDLMHMAFPMASKDEFRQQMQAHGVRVDDDPSPRLLWVYDPDGYELEMVERRAQ
jgi:catechol 2,3-dioxygenase-like lactoylglutathione lyase family enzyme